VGVVCIAIIAICTTLIAMKLVGNARVADLTQYKLYELSGGTRSILAKLNQPVKLRFYYASTAALKGPEDIRYFNNYANYVRSLLEEYVRLSHGRLKLEVIDPRPFSREEEEAQEYGLKRLPITQEEGFIFGLVASTELGKHKQIEFFQPERQELVEYDVSRTISDLMQCEKKTVGVIAGLPVAGEEMSPYLIQMLQMQGQNPPQPWTVITHLRQSYDVKVVQAKEGKLTEKVDYLMVIQPKELEPQTLFAIDQFVMGGGQLAVFEDPFCYADVPDRRQNPYATGDASSSLNMLTAKWGVMMEEGKIAADRALGMSPGMQGNRPAAPLPTLLELRGKDVFNRNNPITRDLDSVHLFAAGALRKTGEAGMSVEPLLQTTRTGTTWKPDSLYQLRQMDGEAIRSKLLDGNGPVLLACAITGPFKSNYPDGLDIPDPNAKDNPATAPAGDPEEGNVASRPASRPAVKMLHLEAAKTAAAGARVIVVADVDMVSDMLAYTRSPFGIAQFGGNAPFVMNTLDFLAGSSELIAIRTRGQFARPFDRVDRIEEKAARDTEAEVEAIRARLTEYQTKLTQLEKGTTAENEALIENQALQARKTIEAEVTKANGEMRRLQARRHRSVEQLGQQLQTLDMVAAPGVLLLVAIVLAIIRYGRARRYAARRAEL
jgi:ABC-type uncharacterized transport system involved in gliding motility auxiliary subunit